MASIDGDADAPNTWGTGTQGRLTVHLDFARHLPAADSNSSSDPYILVKPHGVRAKRSRCILRTLDPRFSQNLLFDGTLDGFCSKPLVLKVFDRDMLSLNDPLGTCTVSLAAFRAPPGEDHTTAVVTQGTAFWNGSGTAGPHAGAPLAPQQITDTLHFPNHPLQQKRRPQTASVGDLSPVRRWRARGGRAPETSSGVAATDGDAAGRPSTLSFSVSFELKPNRIAFPAAPVHAVAPGVSELVPTGHGAHPCEMLSVNVLLCSSPP